VFEGSVYDISEYLHMHPGGSDLLTPYFGKSIDEPFYENEHTKAALNIFNDLPKVGVIVNGKSLRNSEGDVSTSEGESYTTRKGDPVGLDGYVLKGSWKPDYTKGIVW
jgi:cytochrome b involved in lipid metabolism